MPEKSKPSKSECSVATAAPSQSGAYDLDAAGDFIQRVKELGATAVTVGNIAVRFPDVMGLAPRKPPAHMSPEEARAIREHSA